MPIVKPDTEYQTGINKYTRNINVRAENNANHIIKTHLDERKYFDKPTDLLNLRYNNRNRIKKIFFRHRSFNKAISNNKNKSNRNKKSVTKYVGYFEQETGSIVPIVSSRFNKIYHDAITQINPQYTLSKELSVYFKNINISDKIAKFLQERHMPVEKDATKSIVWLRLEPETKNKLAELKKRWMDEKSSDSESFTANMEFRYEMQKIFGIESGDALKLNDNLKNILGNGRGGIYESIRTYLENYQTIENAANTQARKDRSSSIK